MDRALVPHPGYRSARRLRSEVPGLFGDATRAREIATVLSAIEGVGEVRASPLTGRVLVTFRQPEPSVRERVHSALARETDAAAAPPPTVRRCVASALRGVARAWRHARVYRADGRVVADVGGEPAEPWHARDVDAIASALGVVPSDGLDGVIAEAKLVELGPNVFADVPSRTRGQILSTQVLTVPVALLGGAVGLSALLGDFLEAGAILLVIGFNIAIGYVTEARSEERLDAWRSLHARSARVRRDGRELVVVASSLVPGDLLLLRAGDALAADARILEARGFAVDESALTGESQPVEKDPAPTSEMAPIAERTCMAYAGTTVASGDAVGVVVATGERTELGALQKALSHATAGPAPLDRQLADLGKRLAAVSVGSAGVMVVTSLLRGRPVVAVAKSAVALGVAAIPEGLPTAGITALALASRRLFQKGIVIRRLAAAETLGAVSVVCADKTGTLTQNRMRVEEIYLPEAGLYGLRWTPGGASFVGRDGRTPRPDQLHDVARIAALNSDVEVDARGAIRSGSGTERALADLALAAGYPLARGRRAARRVDAELRSPIHPFMITAHEHPSLGLIELVKGAPEDVLERCRLEAAERANLVAENDAMASRGLRVLALGWRRNGRIQAGEPFDFAGLVGMRDPVRPGVRDALARLARAGITTVMLTGDQRATAEAIGRELGIPPERVHSRVTPADKVAVVAQLQREGHVVAMTGDGVNDGPALKAADVGIAMGERGTDVARAVADVVLATDDLPSIASAVQEGRRLYDNIRRAVDYLIATNMSEVLVAVLGSLLERPLLTPLQLLWLNILTDVAPALGLALEPADRDVMARPPRDSQVPLLGRRDYERLGADAGAMAATALTAYAIGRARAGADRGATMAFAALVAAQILHVRARRATVGEPSASNPALAWAVAAAVGAQALALGEPSLRRVLACGGLGAAELTVALALGAVPTLVRERGALLGEPRDAIVVTHEQASAAAQTRQLDEAVREQREEE